MSDPDADTLAETGLASDHNASTELPRTLGRYELIHELGRGGMARVFLARVCGPGGFLKWVAIKTIHGHLAKDQRATSMFLDEARIAASIQHPNVVQILDLGQEQGEHYIAMEYLHGEQLNELSTEAHASLGGLPLEVAAHIIAETARGLHHAHESRDATGQPLALVHRDVTPHNVMVTYDGQVKLTDFGVVKAAGRISSTTTPGQAKGKWAYMAPEQVLGEGVDRRSDIFALGTVLWEITTGQRLFKSDSQVRTVMRITSGHVVQPSKALPGYPEKLERIVLRALARRPDDRFQNAAAMAEELDEFVALTGKPVQAPDLSVLMSQLFAARQATKEELLKVEATRALADRGRSPEVTPAPSEPTAATVPALPPSDLSTGSGSVSVIAPRRGRGALVVTVLLLLAAGLAVVLWLAGPEEAATATVNLSTSPSGARVIVDGQPRTGVSPMILRGVSAGRHQLSLTLEGFSPLEATFDVGGERVDLLYQLRPIASSPSPMPPTKGVPAEVADAGGPARQAPEEAGPPEASPPEAGPSRAPEPHRGQPRERPSAYLNLLARPSARVWINGRPAGQTPLIRQAIPSGPVRVKLVPEQGGRPTSLRLNAAPGQTISRQVDLTE